MLVEAKYKNDKMIATHVERISEQSEYCRDLAKDQSNGFTKDRLGRRIGSFPNVTLLAYDQSHPGWMKRIEGSWGWKEKQKAWREFLNSDYAKPFMMVEKLKH